jgi:F420H(2)-dependent quinone reductase
VGYSERTFINGGALTEPMLRRAYFQALWHLHRLAYRASGGRAGGGALELQTVGRRSGEPRMTLLNYLIDDERVIVVASNAGATRHPAWWLNLLARPDARIVIDGRERAVIAREVRGDDRDRLWRRIVAWNAAYAGYEARSGRLIPVVALDPAD